MQAYPSTQSVLRSLPKRGGSPAGAHYISCARMNFSFCVVLSCISLVSMTLSHDSHTAHQVFNGKEVAKLALSASMTERRYSVPATRVMHAVLTFPCLSRPVNFPAGLRSPRSRSRKNPCSTISERTSAGPRPPGESPASVTPAHCFKGT